VSNLRQQFGVLRHRDFRYLWLAQSASVVGDRVVTVALALFVIKLTGDATDLGLVLAASSLPLVAFLLLGGVWADRLPRHRVMVVTDLIRFALHAILAALIFTGVIRIWELIAIEALFGTAEAFFRPAASGLLPQTVPDDEIQQASSLSSLSNNLGQFAGPTLATALVLGLGAGWAFALDAATFLLSAALLARVSPRQRGVSASAAKPEPLSVWSEVREGFREVRSRRWVSATLAAFSVAIAALAPWFVLGPIVAREQYGHVGIFGLVSAALGFGTIAGALLGSNWRPRFPMRAAMLAILLWPVTAILFASGITLAIVLPAMLVGGGGMALFDIWWETALAERIPPDKLSRVSSFDWMVSFGLLPLGFILAGPLAGALGAPDVFIGGAVVASLALVLGLLPRETRMLARLSPAVFAMGEEGLEPPTRGL
jgi:MFS family permease